jgi:UDP-glucose 4-epimerase
MVVLVTGAYGFLGRAISTELERSGHVVARAGRPHVELRSAQFAELLADADPETVVHCAGPASVALSVNDPAADFDGSAGVLADLLALLARRPLPPRIAVLSSAAVYGDPDTLPVAETAPTRPVSPYGFHRVACEVLLNEYRELQGGDAVSLRVFSAYGEGLRRQVLWDICSRALTEVAVELQGTGDESRDFIHASDVSRAVTRILQEPVFPSDALNVATGRETTISDLAHILLDALGNPAVVRFTGVPRPGDPARWCADVDLLRKLDFDPIVPIEEGARAYAAWCRRTLDA